MDRLRNSLTGNVRFTDNEQIERYKLYCYSGASYNCMMAWLKGGCKESPEEMGAYLSGFFAELADIYDV